MRLHGGCRARRRLPALLLCLLLASRSAAVAQAHGADSRPLLSGHWSFELTEALNAAGAPEVLQPASTEPTRAVAVWRALEGASTAGLDVSLAAAWARNLEREAGLARSGPWGFVGTLGLERSRAGLLAERGGFVDGMVDVRLGARTHAWIAATGATSGGGAELRSGGLAVRLGPAQVLAGRVTVRLGQGTSRILMSGLTPVDGLLVGSREPFRLPGPLGALGPASAHLFVAPRAGSPGAAGAWLAASDLSVEPHPRVRVGLLRTVRFAGEGRPGVTPRNVLDLVFGRGGDSGFDDAQGELAVRVRWLLAGRPVATYASFGFEDVPSLWEDPGLVAGVLLPVSSGPGLLAVRYEYAAFGKRAQWCWACEYRSHRWYAQREFGEYIADGVLLGSTLGGYGARHTLGVTFWSRDASFRLALAGFQEDREPANLLADRWPGRRRGVQVGGALRPGPRMEVRGSVVSASTERGRENGVEVAVVAFAAGPGRH